MGCESWTVECLWKIWCHDVKRVNWHAPTKFGPNIACGFQGALQWPTHRQLSKRLPNAITPWEKQPRISWKRPAATFWCNVTSDWSCEGFDGNEGKHVHHANSAKKEKKNQGKLLLNSFSIYKHIGKFDGMKSLSLITLCRRVSSFAADESS